MNRLPSRIVGIIALDDPMDTFSVRTELYGTPLVRFIVSDNEPCWSSPSRSFVRADVDQLQIELDLAYAELVDQMR